MQTPQRPEVALNPNIRGIGKSPTMAIQERADALVHAGRAIYRLGLGQSPFPVPAEVVESLREHAARKEYLPVRGLPELREAVADYHRRRHGTGCDAADVLIGPGSKELMFLLQVVYRGDLLIPTPAWVSYAPQAQIAGRTVQLLHTDASDGWRLQPEALDALCRVEPDRPRVLVLNYPNNPTGGTYTEPDVKALAEVCARRGVVVLSDEIYAELHHTGGHVSIERFYPNGTIVSSGLSKWCGAGGWRLGTFAFPPALRWLLEAMEAVASETYTTTSAPIQCAAVRAFRGSLEIERYLWRARRILHALGASIHRRLCAAGANVEPPVGGFYLFPDFAPLAERLRSRGVTTSDELCERLLDDTGVAMLPGSAFGRGPAELTARIAYVDFDGAQAMAACEEIGGSDPLSDDFLDRYCARVIVAVDRLCDWIA